MFSRAVNTWHEWPIWAKWTAAIGAIVIIEAVSVASQERNFVAAFAEYAVAIVLRYAALIGPAAAGLWIGMQVAKRSKTWLGWVAGVAVWVITSIAAVTVTEAIPGVGWRINAMNNSDCHVEWDGRSNPTVC